MRIVMTGAGGFIGGRLLRALFAKGHTVTTVAHHQCDIAGSQFPGAAIEGAGAVIHLAGEPVAQRWSTPAKLRIRASRVQGTARLVEAIGRAGRGPRTLISASAIGYYGSCGEQILTEDSPPGTDFLAGVCREWEAAAGRAEQFGCRVVQLRIGMVLGAGGGALAKMLTPFRLGLGGRLGSGKQWVSWIHLEDLVAILEELLEDHRYSGPVNATAPEPVRNEEFTRELAGILHRPALLPMPAFALRLVFGELSNVFLASQKVLPARLNRAGFLFRYPELRAALGNLLGAPEP